MIIDAHQHFWKYDSENYSWIDESMSAIKHSFLPADMQEILVKNNIAGTVLVQVNQCPEENDFFLSLAAQNDFIKGIVGWVNLQADDITEQLSVLKQHSIIKGFRHILQAEKKPGFMQCAKFESGIAALQQAGFTYDILIHPGQLTDALLLVKRFPNQPFVIDHLAKPYIKNKLIKDWKADIERIAVYQNVYCKISGMVTEADWQHWQQEDLRPYMDAAVEAFGINRIMFGSDWPVCVVAADYAQVVNVAQHYFSSFSKDEQHNFFSKNAIDFYKLN